MKRPAVVLLVACVAYGPLFAENRMFIEPKTVAVGQQGAVLPVLLDSDQSIYAFSLSVATDPGLLKIVGVNMDGTASAGAEWNAGQVLDGGARVSWGVVLDISDPFDVGRVIPAGSGIKIANVLLDVTATSAGSATVEFKSFPSSDLLALPDAKNVLVSTQGKSVTPTAQAGTVTIGSGGATFVRWDSNSDSKVDISDAVFHLNYLFLGGPAPLCMDASDSDDNGALEITDAIFTLAFLFQGGKPIPPPNPDAGPDPTPDGLGCEG